MAGQIGPSRPHRAGNHLARGLYATAVALSAVCLFGSIGLQIFGAPGAHDGVRAHRHQTYCEAELWHLQRLLHEAAPQGVAPVKSAALRGREALAWRARLAEVQARCHDLPTHAQLASTLATLRGRYAAVDAELTELSRGPAAELAAGLRVLP